MSKFNEGIESQYAELPVEVNYLYWKRGNGQLEHLKDTDPGAYFGGWTASVDGEEEPRPALPLPVVTRKSDDGKAEYRRYATNVLHFLPIASRTRYELRQKTFDAKKGRDMEKVVAVSKEYTSGVTIGYQPLKQVFGLAYSADGATFAPAVLQLNKWSSFLSFSDAARAWAKVATPDDKALIRRYGTTGTHDKNLVYPTFNTFNEGKSTPIEAIGTSKPIFITVTPELDKLWENAQAWTKCEKWNAVGKAPEISEAPLPVAGYIPETEPEFMQD